jgi:ribosomal protein S12 methylthiotransferase accessory factor
MTAVKPALRHLAGAVEELVDNRVGIIQSVEEVRPDAGEPDFFHFWAKACEVEAFSPQRNFAKGGGAAIDRGAALAKAIGEAVERYCSALFEFEELPLTSYDEAPFACVAPEEFALYRPAQYESPGFPYLPFERATIVRWAPALDAATGERCNVPAVFVYVPYYFYQGSGDTPIAQPISTGLACHVGPAEAAVSAVCEVIERDAFTITWQGRLSRPRIPLETLPPALGDAAARFELTGHTVSLLDITLDVGVPTILGVLRGNSPEAAQLVTAAATSLDPAVAALKALEELDHTRSYCQRLRTEVPRLEPDPSYANVVDQESHLNFWCEPANRALADFLTAADETVGFGEFKNLSTGDAASDLEALAERVSALGHRVLLTDLTTPDVREAGLAVVRAVIPGFHPLVVGHRFRALGGRRLWEVPQRLGYSGLDPDIGDNPTPHPYP